jgi:hypothetical protein
MTVTMVEAGDWAVQLREPLLLRVGEHIWLEAAAVVVRQAGGEAIRHEGDGVWRCR